jgi:Retroviral aspartyl protease
LLEDHDFDLLKWYDKQLNKPWVTKPQGYNAVLPNEDDYFFTLEEPLEAPEWAYALNELYHNVSAVILAHTKLPDENELQLSGIQVLWDQLAAIARNAAVTRDTMRVVLKPIVVVARINDQSVRVLIDSGSLGDFMSTTLADQLWVMRIILAKPLHLQLAVQGSRSKVNSGTNVLFQYQDIKELRYFDIMNISNYNIIFGTLWLFQHQVTIGLNPIMVVVGSTESQPLRGESVTRIAS